MNPIELTLQMQKKMYGFENNPMLGKDPDEDHDMMMDTAAEKIDDCDCFEDFWKMMEPEGMSEQHARRLWADEMENQHSKWANL